MKAEELMVNDLVNEGQDKVIKIYQNYGKSITYIDELDTKYYPAKTCRAVEETCLSPIPLTKEVLKANGFILKGKTSEYDYDSYYKYYVDKCKKIYELNYTPIIGCIETSWKNRIHGIKYVHELQHALRLCGLNELADNFKIE